mmetsp:Transcript_5107/g.17023  ORF Transcript_5107/g.17023 Transcript_5107/m.17023 type:complete len:504 (+) Transcript_5107:1531-3042(+)
MCTWSWPLLHVCERKRWYSPPALERKRGGWRVERHNSWRRRLASLKRRATKKRAIAKRAMTPAAGRTVVRSTLRKCSSSSSGGSSQSTPRYPPVQTHTPSISQWPWPEHWISSIFSPALRTPGCSRRSHARCSQVGCGKSIGPSDGSPPPLRVPKIDRQVFDCPAVGHAGDDGLVHPAGLELEDHHVLVRLPVFVVRQVRKELKQRRRIEGGGHLVRLERARALDGVCERTARRKGRRADVGDELTSVRPLELPRELDRGEIGPSATPRERGVPHHRLDGVLGRPRQRERSRRAELRVDPALTQRGGGHHGEGRPAELLQCEHQPFAGAEVRAPDQQRHALVSERLQRLLDVVDVLLADADREGGRDGCDEREATRVESHGHAGLLRDASAEGAHDGGELGAGRDEARLEALPASRPAAARRHSPPAAVEAAVAGVCGVDNGLDGGLDVPGRGGQHAEGEVVLRDHRRRCGGGGEHNGLVGVRLARCVVGEARRKAPEHEVGA